MPILKVPTELEKQVKTLEAEIQVKDTELKQLKVKAKKRPSLGFFRSRFR